MDFAAGDLPTNWDSTNTYTGGVDRAGSGGFSRGFSVDETRNYDIWIAGSYPGRLKLQVDGQTVFSGRSVFEGNPFLTNPLSRARLSAGYHVLTLNYDRPVLLPGSDGNSRFGPIYLSTETAGDVKVKQVSNSNLAKLCTQNLDWIAIAR